MAWAGIAAPVYEMPFDVLNFFWYCRVKVSFGTSEFDLRRVAMSEPGLVPPI